MDSTTKKCTVETNKPAVATAKLVENGVSKPRLTLRSERKISKLATALDGLL